MSKNKAQHNANLSKRRSKSSSGILLLILTISLSVNQCGFLRNARVSKDYLETMGPDSAEECLVTWPFHAILLPITAIIDQSIHTFEIIPEAGVDALDYFFLKVNDNNIMLERTIFIPKALATPVIFVLSYITRWLIPIDEDTAPFENTKGQAPEPEYEATQFHSNKRPGCQVFLPGDNSAKI